MFRLNQVRASLLDLPVLSDDPVRASISNNVSAWGGMTKSTFDVCLLVMFIPPMFFLVRYGRTMEWMSSPGVWYSIMILISLGLHFAIYRPIVKRLFPTKEAVE